jgi:competence protein ComEA
MHIYYIEPVGKGCRYLIYKDINMKKFRLLSCALLATSLFASLSFASEKINLNTASASELANALQGIGVARAELIVEYRDAKGPFVSVEELTEVSGIGPATLERNRAILTVTDEGSQE